MSRANIAGEEVFLQPDNSELSVERRPPLPDVSVLAKARVQHEILQKEIELLRARLDIIRVQAKVVLRSRATWANASARLQLGSYSWAKFAAIALGYFFVTKALRKLPLGSIAAALMPLVPGVLERRRSRHD